MLLVIDVGNTNIVLGIYKEETLLNHWRISTNRSATEDEYGMIIVDLFRYAHLDITHITGVIISTVVPPLQTVLMRFAKKYLNLEAMMVGAHLHLGLDVCYDNPNDVGADRLVNAVAAIARYGAPLIIVDFGTATTFCCIDTQHRYLGGVICPGIGISTEALFQRAAKLPRIDLIKPPTVMGKNTIQSMQSGIIYGYGGQVDGIVNRLKIEMQLDHITVVATGGLSDIIATVAETITLVDKNLTLDGLRLIYEKNKS